MNAAVAIMDKRDTPDYGHMKSGFDFMIVPLSPEPHGPIKADK